MPKLTFPFFTLALMSKLQKSEADYARAVSDRDDLTQQVKSLQKDKKTRLYEKEDLSVSTQGELTLRTLSHRQGELHLLEEQVQLGNYVNNALFIFVYFIYL